PLWQLITQLDQRREPVGTGIVTQQALSSTPFRLPHQWLLRYGPKEANWLAAIEAEHLLIFDETAGYLIADVPLQGRSDEQAMLEEVAYYRAQGIDVRWHRGEARPREPLHPSITPFLSEFALWWLERVIGFVHTLLARALDATEEEIAIPALLCKHGQLF